MLKTPKDLSTRRTIGPPRENFKYAPLVEGGTQPMVGEKWTISR